MLEKMTDFGVTMVVTQLVATEIERHIQKEVHYV